MTVGRRVVTAELQAATTVLAAETAIGSAIDVRHFNTMTVYIDYTNGDETSYAIIPKMLRVPSGDEHPLCSWSNAAGAKTVTADSFSMTATGKYYMMIDVRGINLIKIYGDATGGSPTGTAQIGYTLISE